MRRPQRPDPPCTAGALSAAAAAAPPQTWPTPCRRSRRAGEQSGLQHVTRACCAGHHAPRSHADRTVKHACLLQCTRHPPGLFLLLLLLWLLLHVTGPAQTRSSHTALRPTADRHTLGCRDASAHDQKQRLCDSPPPHQLVVVMQNTGTPQQSHQQWQGCTLLLLGHQQRPVRRRQLGQLVGGCVDLDGRQLRRGRKGEAAVVAGRLWHPPAWQQQRMPATRTAILRNAWLLRPGVLCVQAISQAAYGAKVPA